ncbi:bifunctional (p)ppGpp synthetase/guanosine-3',5'-bis(diphosphate) 3'-pyrophosphohydrolase [Patescibacteria group bacterium]|nr:bifunctional (p)ppGpp synthetase/guanosine-3',5'-bis(diphosphate) 3'-pyrophosphohydrolase [Patescibacteria group bacterium]
MPEIKEIIDLMNSPSQRDIKLITKAYDFAHNAHKGHKRNSGDPYFVHLFETAKTLAELGMGPRTISAGFLHDTIEDTSITSEKLKSSFGNKILYLVEGVTKLGSLKYHGTKKHTESLRKLFVATSQDLRVLIIKLADRLHNMKTLEFVPENKQKRIALETLEIYAPIADRLGMGQLKGELEDLAFPFVYPEKYEEVLHLLKMKSKETLKHLEKIYKSLKKSLAKHDITNIRTEYRMKRLYSLYQKLKHKDWDIDKIYDISALRIITSTVSECYQILGIIHNNWRPLPGKIKDYISFEKPNGYQSLHTTVFTGDGGIVEIQIRTEKMNREAQYGVAAHISYKDYFKSKKISPNLLWFKDLLPVMEWGNNSKSAVKKKGPKYTRPTIPQWIQQIAESQKGVSGSEEFLDTLRTDFFSYRVFVFTPRGDVVDLPVDSSPVDFAYAIHSDIGDHISGTKVNGKLVSLETKLRNGDIVEIMTKESSHPTQKWMNFAKTTIARRHIKSTLQKNN